MAKDRLSHWFVLEFLVRLHPVREWFGSLVLGWFSSKGVDSLLEKLEKSENFTDMGVMASFETGGYPDGQFPTGKLWGAPRVVTTSGGYPGDSVAMSRGLRQRIHGS